MATDKGPVAAEPAAHASVSVESLTAEAARATQSLKRHREATPPTSPGSTTHPHFGAEMSPSKAARIIGLSSRHSPLPPMTGAAAQEDERRRREEDQRQHEHEHERLQPSGASENPAYRAHSELLSPRALGMSRPHDAPSHSNEASAPEPEPASESIQPVAHSSPPPAPILKSAPEPAPTIEAAPAIEPPAEQPPENPDAAAHAPEPGPEPETVQQEIDHHIAHQAVQVAANEAARGLAQEPQQTEYEENRGTAQELHKEPPHATPDVSHDGREVETQHLPPPPPPPTQQAEARARSPLNVQDSLPTSASTVGEVDHRNGESVPGRITSVGSASGEAPPVTASPGPMEVDARDAYVEPEAEEDQPPVQIEDKGGISLSYPPMSQTSPSMPTSVAPDRGMSLPMAPGAPRSPNSKKHKCPYCATEFTRHHNLKSHLLTHSQEKPFICTTCHMRFRRLHDLKRHSKLHTGEKPHICPKCDRKFARGDALARHSKGPGGCVGRRSSMGGSFLGDDDPDGSSQLEGNDTVMSDMSYDAHPEDADMPEEERRRLSMKSQHIQGSGMSSLPVGHSNPSPYNQSGVTESPKPLSPGIAAQDVANAHRQRSPSLASHLQHQHFSRQQSEPQTSPVSNSYTTTAIDAARYAAAAAGTSPGAVAAHNAQVQHDSEAAGHGGPAQHGSGGEGHASNLSSSEHEVWEYVHSLEDQVRGLNQRLHSLETTERQREDLIGTMYNELMALRSQVGAMAKHGALDAETPAPEVVDDPAAHDQVEADEPVDDLTAETAAEMPSDVIPEEHAEEHVQETTQEHAQQHAQEHAEDPAHEPVQDEAVHDGSAHGQAVHDLAPASTEPSDMPAVTAATVPESAVLESTAPEATSTHVEMVDA